MSILPELKSGDRLISPHGQVVRIVKLNKPKRRLEHDEPTYKLVHINALNTRHDVMSDYEWTLDELMQQNMEIDNEK